MAYSERISTANFSADDYVSKFARSGVEAIYEFATHGLLESDATVAEQLNSPAAACSPARKAAAHHPAARRIELRHHGRARHQGAGRTISGHFRSFDGKARKLIVEGAGGPSWYTEYNVLTGLSARSFGRFATFVTRIAAGHVARGLPHALQPLRLQDLQPLSRSMAPFTSARGFQTTAGIEHYLRHARIWARAASSPTVSISTRPTQIIARERGDGPLFLFVYIAANHFPWDIRFRPELTPDWRDLGNAPNIDEYMRRQSMSARDYAAFLERLQARFPDEVVPARAVRRSSAGIRQRIIDPSLDRSQIARQLEATIRAISPPTMRSTP